MSTHTETDDRSSTPPVLPTSMRAVVARRYGLPADVLSIAEVPVPVPASGEVLVRVEASSLNALDWHFVTGTPYVMRAMSGLRRPKRRTPGADVAGTIVATGPDVTRFALGDAVFGETAGGACAPYLAVHQDRIVAKPAAVTFEAAGALPVAGLTALQGLRTHADVRAGDRVLINGAAGGVGTFAVQIAVALGAEVTAVCSTRNVEMVRSLGAADVIDYTVDDIVQRGDRFDVVFDNVGNRTPAECIGLLVTEGRYVVVTGPKSNRWLGPLSYIARAALAFRRASPSFHQFTASPNHDDLTALGDLVARGAVVPQIQRVVDLDGVVEGLTEIGTGHTQAKIAVLPT